MGYSKSLSAIKRVELYLSAMRDGRRITWSHPEPKKLTYAIHQGMYSAKYNNIKPFAELYDTYIVMCKEGRVIAESKKWKPEIIEDTTEKVQLIDEQAITLYDIVSVLLSTKFDVIKFPNATLSDLDIMKLGKWLSKNGFNMIEFSEVLTIERIKNGSSINET
jgi:hypothetical protein